MKVEKKEEWFKFEARARPLAGLSILITLAFCFLIMKIPLYPLLVTVITCLYLRLNEKRMKIRGLKNESKIEKKEERQNKTDLKQY
jgi:hypothetical protein